MSRSAPQPPLGLDDEDDAETPPFVHAWTAAADAPAPVTRAPRSIFDMVSVIKAAGKMAKRGRFGAASGFKVTPTTSPYPEQAPTVERADGVVRVAGARYPSNRWDDAREERERERRARQRPPKPVKKAKTRGKKVRQWDGEGIE
jgi:hypothetical protein